MNRLCTELAAAAAQEGGGLQVGVDFALGQDTSDLGGQLQPRIIHARACNHKSE